jgi:hypothetical protein
MLLGRGKILTDFLYVNLIRLIQSARGLLSQMESRLFERILAFGREIRIQVFSVTT